MAKKANKNSNWIIWAIVAVILGAIGWKFFGSEIVGTKASTLGGGVVNFRIATDSPISSMVLGGARDQADSIWSLTFVPDLGSDVSAVALKGLTLTVGPSKTTPPMQNLSPISKAYLRLNGTTGILATASPVGTKLVFNLSKDIKLLANKQTKVAISVDYNKVDGVKLTNDYPYSTYVANPKDVGVTSADGTVPVDVRFDGSVVASIKYLFKSYLKLGFNAGSPSGLVIRQANHTIAKYNAQATSNIADVTFGGKVGNYLRVNFSSKKPTGTPTVVYLKDGMTGTTVGSAIVDLSKNGNAMIEYKFPTEYSVPYSGRVLNLVADTLALVDSGVSMAISINGDDALGWGVESKGNYRHGNIILPYGKGLVRALTFQ